MIAIDRIKPNPDNPRTITDAKFKQLVQSIKDFPEMLKLRPIVVNQDGMALGGNMRHRAAKAAGLKQVPVVRAEHLTEAQQKEFIIKDNVGFGEWDWHQLSEAWDLPALEAWGLDIPEMALDLPEVKEDGYDVPDDLDSEVNPGDLFQIGPHRLICGDSTKGSTLARLMAGKQADMVLTDPPYNVDYEGGTGMKLQNDNMSDGAFYEFLLAAFQTAAEHTRDGGAWYVWHADSEGLNFRRAFKDSGILMKQTLVWAKNALVMGRQDYQWRHEPCLYGWKPGAAHYFVTDRTNTTLIDDKADYHKMTKAELLKFVDEIMAEETKTTVLYHNKPQRNDLHPTMKPVVLMGELIQNSSRPGQLVLDPFAGAASTLIAGHQLRRTVYLAELDPRYCSVILDRVRKFAPELEIKRITDGHEFN